MIKSIHKLSNKHYIQWLLSFVCALLLLLIIIFVKLQNDLSFSETYFLNETARIDVIPYEGNNIKLSTDFNGNIIYPDWANDKHGQGMIFSIPITHKWKIYNINITPDHSGVLKITMRGPWKQSDNKTLPIHVNYRNLYIDGKKIEMPTDNFWHDDPFISQVKIKKGKPLEISFESKKPFPTIKEIIEHNNLNKYIQFSLFLIFIFAFRKIIRYMAEFHYNNHSRIDVLFLIIFFLLLFVPMSHISDAEKSEQENRMLAKKPQILVDGENNYGVQFDAWFNDRFWGRDLLISLHSILNFIIPRYVENKLAIKLPNDMIFNKAILKRLTNPIQHKMLEKISQNIAELQKFAKQIILNYI